MQLNMHVGLCGAYSLAHEYQDFTQMIRKCVLNNPTPPYDYIVIV